MLEAEAVTEDRLLAGRVRLRQRRRGHRAGTDAVLLAACVTAEPGEVVADLGAGTGAVGIMVALRTGADLLLVERDPDLVALCRENLQLNGLAGYAIEADLLAPKPDRRARGLAPGSAGWVATNPPFHDPARARASPNPGRSAAHLMPTEALGAWLEAAADLLVTQGRIALIHRADALADALPPLARAFGALIVRPVHPHREAAATRILLTATKGSRAPLTLAPPLVLHEPDGTFTPFAAALHRGEATLA